MDAQREPIIKFRGVIKSIGDRSILRHIDLELKAEEK